MRGALADLKQLYFGLQGRINREQYIYGWLFMFMLQGVMLAQLINAPEESGRQVFWFLVWALASFASTIATLIMSVKRARDMGWPPIIAFALVIPAFSIIGLAIFSIWPGKQSRDRLRNDTPSD